MNCFKVAWKDLKKICKSKFIIVCLIAIIIVPILYSFLYLGAFWDPYGNMSNMPVAVVNLDKGYTIDGIEYNFGNDFVEELKDNDKVKWEFVSLEDADSGLEGNKYYAKFEIPESFSKDITSAKIGLPVQAELKFSCNEKKNFLAAQVSSKVESELKSNIIKSVTNEYVSKTFDSLYEAKDGFAKAADGSSQLNDGMNQLSSQIPTLQNGITDLDEGSNALYTSYTNTIFPTIVKLNDGSSKLNNALNSAQGDINKLSSGAALISQNSDAIISGYGNVQNGYLAVYNGANKLVSGVNEASTLMSSIGAELQSAMVAYQSGDTSKLVPVVMDVLQNLQKYSTENSGSSEQIAALVKGLNDLKTGMNTYNEGLNEYVGGVKQVTDGTNTLIGNISDIQNGVGQLNSGLSQLQSGLNSQFGPGLGALSNGIGTLNSNVPTLKDGVTKLNDGTNELYTELNKGANKIEDGLVNSADNMGNFVSEPITLNVEPVNAVPNYGSGFAPYFMNLSIWVGAIMMFFVISTKVDLSNYDENVSNFSKVTGRYLLSAGVGILQAVFLGIAILGLGLKPGNYLLYFLLLIFFSLVYVSIVYCLVLVFGDAGRLISIVLLILQLTTCAGTFPLELIPNFFGALNPYLPFTYGVEALREACFATTVNYGVIGKDVIVLLVYLIVFELLAVVLRKFGSKINGLFEVRKMK